MKACGIIVEYNPFHNGHKYHLEKAREITGAEVVIACMSGNFLQRGEPSLFNKWVKTEMALLNGVDLVVELPTFYSNDSAEFFAKGSIKILDLLKVENIVFGSEVDNIHILENIVSYTETENFKSTIKDLLKEGISYPKAMSKLVDEKFGERVLNPNNILGIEYIRSIKKLDSNIKPIILHRKSVGYYEDGFKEEIASATGIRKMVEGKKYDEIKKLVPEATYRLMMGNINNIAKIDDYYEFIRLKVISDKKKLEFIADMEEGLWNRIYEICKYSKTFDDFMKEFKNKRYTTGRIKRILCHILLEFNKIEREKLDTQEIYIRALGFNEKGAKYIKYLKKNFEVEVITSNKNIKKSTPDKLDIFEKELVREEIYKMKHYYEDKKFAIKI